MLIGFLSVLVDLTREYAFSASGFQSETKTTDSGEEIDKSEHQIKRPVECA
jgi:hypothetical protein